MATWISHRGVRDQGAPENSLAAFRRAVSLGFDWLETDLHLTADRELVLTHDPIIYGRDDRLDVALSSLKDVLAFSQKYGLQIATFADFVAEFGHLNWTLDIKPRTGRKVIEKLMEQSSLSSVCGKALEGVRFLTWKRRHQQEILSHWPQAIFYADQKSCYIMGLLLLMKLSSLAAKRAVKAKTYSLPPQVAGVHLFTCYNALALHRLGGRALAFLPRTQAQLEQAIGAGFDEILIDYDPDVFSGGPSR